MPTVDRKGLLSILDSKLSAEEVATLVFNLGLDQANLEGETKRARLRSLIDYYERRGQMERLIAAVVALRPDVIAPDSVYAASTPAPPLARWQMHNGRRFMLLGVLMALVLAAVIVGAQWYRSQPRNNVPASASATSSTEQQPNSAIAYYNQADVFRSQGDYGRAIEAYTQAVALQPRYGIAYHRLGNSYEAIGDYTPAMEAYTKAIEFQPNEAVFADRGALYVKLGDPDSAIRDLSAAISRRVDFSRAYYTRGLAYWLKQENEKAIADFQTVVTLDNDVYIRSEAETQLKSI